MTHMNVVTEIDHRGPEPRPTARFVSANEDSAVRWAIDWARQRAFQFGHSDAWLALDDYRESEPPSVLIMAGPKPTDEGLTFLDDEELLKGHTGRYGEFDGEEVYEAILERDIIAEFVVEQVESDL